MIVQTIDIKNWDRREIFDYFSSKENPFFSVTFPIDVTNLYRYVRKYHISFYYAMICVVTRSLNRTLQFRYGYEYGEIVLYDHRVPMFSDLRNGDDQFRIIIVDSEDTDTKEFAARAKEVAETQQAFYIPDTTRQDMIYITCVPWVELTSYSWHGDNNRDDMVPRIAWGKITTTEDGHRRLNISVQANHRLIDSYHIGELYTEMERYIVSLY